MTTGWVTAETTLKQPVFDYQGTEEIIEEEEEEEVTEENDTLARGSSRVNLNQADGTMPK